MVLLQSSHPSLEYPKRVTTWEWLFEDGPESASPLFKRSPRESPGSYIDAFTRRSVDYAAVKRLSTLLSQSLVHQYGLQPGQTVSLFANNTIWYPVAMWAVIRAGGRVNGASPAYGREEMTFALLTAKTRIVMTLPDALPVALAAAKEAGIPKSHVLLLDGRASGFTSIHDLFEQGKTMPETSPWKIPPDTDNRHVCGYLNFSSGTTGFPKAVMLSHHNIIAQCLQLRQLQVTTETRYSILAVMPLFHITGLIRFCTYPVLLNGDSIMLPRFTISSMCQAVMDFQVPELILVPPILIRVVRDPVVKTYNLSCVQRWSSGSAPIAPEIIRELQRQYPHTGFRQGYGATESSACITCHPPTHYDYKYATTGGMLVANTEAKVIHPSTGRELDTGETGEICARGPQIAMGYLGNQDATRDAFDQDGFFHTGDVGHFDREGLVHIEDRIKEMIKVKGQQVAPAELEDLLLGHPEVADCAVIGVKNDYAGERPKAFVVLKKNEGRDGDDQMTAIGLALLEHVKERKVRYKWLVEIEFVEEVPKSPTGKLLRRILKAKEEKGEVGGIRVRSETLVMEKAKL